jgi:alkanesulfonate monooxygenase SsuD/methylene tetrahydromethanopterin reductase-like flavin-dependent oxidoreductase (luciferase family)
MSRVSDNPLFFGLYEQACVGMGAASASLWTHPADERRTATGLPYWLNLARISEQANADLFFFGDVLGIYDVYRDGPETALRWGVELPAHDPLLHIPALAAVTEHLGFGATVSTSYDHPFPHARRMSTLDHLTNGRIAWNIVTSYLRSAARNHGLDEMLPHDERYERAEEFMDAVYALLEGSWADDAYLAPHLDGAKVPSTPTPTPTGVGAGAGPFADPERIRAVDFRGKYFATQGPHVSPPSPQRTPVLIQAGWSPRGKEFGARHAEVVFAGDHEPEALRNGIADFRQTAHKRGRDAGNIKFLTGLTVVVARTRIAAQRKLDSYQQHHNLDAQLAAYSGWSGFDLAKYGDDEPLVKGATNATHSALGSKPVTAGDLRRKYAKVAGNGDPFVIGTPEDVAGAIEDYATRAGTDGFLLHQMISPGSLEDFAELVVPELIERGLYRTQPPTGTLRSRIRADRSDKLPESHPAARWRYQ